MQPHLKLTYTPMVLPLPGTLLTMQKAVPSTLAIRKFIIKIKKKKIKKEKQLAFCWLRELHQLHTWSWGKGRVRRSDWGRAMPAPSSISSKRNGSRSSGYFENGTTALSAIVRSGQGHRHKPGASGLMNYRPDHPFRQSLPLLFAHSKYKAT